MVKHADTSPEARLLQRQQSHRLQHFRRALGLSREKAGEMAGVSRFTWRRMEEGDARIDAVPLRRFLAAFDRHPNLPGEYILSGSTAGLPPDLARDLLELDRLEPLGPEVRSEPPSADIYDLRASAIAGKPRPRRKGSSGTKPGQDGQPEG